MYWLRFFNPAQPAEQRWVGVFIVRAETPTEAETVAVATIAGQNAGYEVLAFELEDDGHIPDSYIGRLLTMAEVETLLGS